MPLKEKLIRKSFAHKRQQLQKSFTFRVAFWSDFHACPQVSNSSMESHSDNGETPWERKRERDNGKRVAHFTFLSWLQWPYNLFLYTISYFIIMIIPFYDVRQSFGLETYTTFSRVQGTSSYQHTFTHQMVQILHSHVCHNPLKELVGRLRAILHKIKSHKKSNIHNQHPK